MIQPPDSDVIYVLGFVGSSQFDIYYIKAKDGELLKHRSSTFSGGFVREISVVSSDMVVALDATRTSLVKVTFHDGEISFQPTFISELLETSSGKAVILPSAVTGMVSIKLNFLTIVLRVTDEGKLEVVEKISDATAISDAISLSTGQQAFALVQHEGSKIHVRVKAGHDWNSDLLRESIHLDNQRGIAHKVFINNYIRTDRTHGFRALIVMEDHSLLLLQQGEIVWSREDGLASIIDVTTSELPVEKQGVSVAKVEHNLFEWLKV